MRFRVHLPAFSLATNTTKHIAMITAVTNARVRSKRLVLFSDGNTQTDKSLNVAYTRTTSGTGTSGGGHTVLAQQGSRTAAPASTVGSAFSAEPTVGSRVYVAGLPPAGMIDQIEPDGGELESDTAGGLGVEINNPSGNSTINVRGFFEFEE